MCGIAGLVSRQGELDKEAALRMLQALRHRGPDEEGMVPLDQVILLHNRLSILDIAGGHQPLRDISTRYWIVFNGEIYNFKKLRKQLEERGYGFKTKSDTEVLLNHIIEHGHEGLSSLNGMFSFAVWDSKKKKLFAARDPMGKKPFYYSIGNQHQFLFASEIKAILKSQLLHAEINQETLDDYLALLYIPSSKTIFRNIHCLPPGHYLEWEDGKIKIQKYWNLDFTINEKIDIQEAVEKLKETVSEAVRLRMVADVPVGAFLSGGLDSSSIVALMQKYTDKPIKTFSVGFGDLINELPYANDVAQKYKTEHHEIQMDIKVGDLLYEMANIYDEPFADSSNIPSFLISKFARQKVKAILSGDGADELFGGYEWYISLLESENIDVTLLAAVYYKASEIFVRILRKLALSPDSGFVRKKITEIAAFRLKQKYPDIGQRHVNSRNYFSPEERMKIWKQDFHRDLAWPTKELPDAYGVKLPRDINGLPSAFAFDIFCYLPGDILTKVDRASMANSLEVRCPFLDINVVKLACSLPVNMKISDGRGKYILRKAFSDLWPSSINNRKKQGFGAPVPQWMKHEDVKEIVFDVVLKKDSFLASYFDHSKISSMFSSYYDSDKEDGGLAYKLWILLCLALWGEKWGRGFQP